MHGILAWDALLVAGTGHGQVLHYSICHNLLSVYIECYSCVGFKQQGYSQTECQERKAHVVYLLWQTSAALLIHSAELHKHSSLVQALLPPPPPHPNPIPGGS